MRKFILFVFIFSILFSFRMTSSQQIESDQAAIMDLQAANYISISPCALKPYLSLDYGYTFWADYTEFYFESTGGNMVTPVAPIYLPHGAEITGFGVIYTDDGAGIDDAMNFSISRTHVLTGVSDTLGWCTTDIPGFPSSPNRRILKDLSINYGIVDNLHYTYTLHVKFYDGSDRIKFHGAVIGYH